MASNSDSSSCSPTATRYRYSYVSPPDGELICVVCLEVAEKPWNMLTVGDCSVRSV